MLQNVYIPMTWCHQVFHEIITNKILNAGGDVKNSILAEG